MFIEAVHVGISTQTDDGLMVPVIKHAESLDVWNTANELVRNQWQEKTATVEELTGSTITITSLGAMGGLGATPIINHPEVSIVSIHAARDRAVVREGEIVVRKMMNLTFDHRIIDGYDDIADTGFEINVRKSCNNFHVRLYGRN